MGIDFHSEKNRYTYATRHADTSWAETIASVLAPAGKRVADVGCGGGIYSLAWHELGAQAVVGVDFSEQMVTAAREKAAGQPHISFRQGSADATGLAAQSVDVVFQRALIHHLKSYDACMAEASRVLVAGGHLLIQDRTPDDVNIPGSPDHIRGYFFEQFPRLRAIESGRRPTRQAVEQALSDAGFTHVETRTLWETRRTYTGFEELAQDLAARTGRSILHELSDAELQALIAHVRTQLPSAGPIAEKDRWTLWSAVKA